MFVATHEVHTLARLLTAPRKLVWDRSKHRPTESALYFTTKHSIQRYENETGRITTCFTSEELDPCGIDSTPDGERLIITCIATHSVYAFDPTTRVMKLLAGRGISAATPEKPAVVNGSGAAARFWRPFDLTAVSGADNQLISVFIADSGNGLIRCVTLLPSHLN